jgi:aspartyl-tRNA(Asn)/glutamyl-tRNA(Gln) amidotransferase subunit C
MKIGNKEIQHVALLARLELSEEEIKQFTGQLDAILTYVDKLNELDTRGVEPTSHAIQVGNVVREDHVKESIPVQEALANAPEQDNDFFKVPRII